MDSGTLGLASALAELGIYELADLVEMARAGGLHEMIVHVVAIDQGQLEQRVEQAVRIHKLAADRRAALLSQAEARAAAAERLQRQAEARHTSLPQKPIMPSVQVQQVSSTVSGCLRNARTQTPTRMVAQVSVATQVPSSEIAAAAEMKQRENEELLVLSARQRAHNDLLPVLERAIAAAEAAERMASERKADAHRTYNHVRLMAERKAREAAAATADRAAAAEERAADAEERAAAANERRVWFAEFMVELAVLCGCVSELKEENMDLQDTVLGLYEFLQKARQGPCRSCTVNHEHTTGQPGSPMSDAGM